MNYEEWVAEVRRRIAVNEGCILNLYFDTVGVPTIGYGFNLQRSDAAKCLAACGVTDIQDVIAGKKPLTQEEADALFDRDLPVYIADARASLGPRVFDSLSDARRFVLCDLEYNLGQRGWLGFAATRALINEAQAAKDAGKSSLAHNLFSLAADHLRASAWDSQVGDRARRDEAMMRSSLWVDATGDGSF